MLHSAVDRASAALRGVRGGVAATVARPALHGMITDDAALRAEFASRARSAGLVITVFAAVAFPAWTGFDVLLEPQRAALFGLVRLGAPEGEPVSRSGAR